MTKISKDKIKLFIVDRDAIFRLGLRTAIASYGDFAIVGEGDASNDTFRVLTRGLVLNVLVIGIDDSNSLEFCQRLGELYPQLPIFVLTPSNLSAKQLSRIRSWGIKGYCDRTSSINTIVEGLQTVAYGNIYWQNYHTPPKLWQKALGRISQSGRIELEETLREIEAQLKNRNLSDWEKVFLVGRKRELLVARWLSNRLVAEEVNLPEEQAEIEQSDKGELILASSTELNPLPVFVDSANQAIFERVVTEIQLGLLNKTDFLLEIDILQPHVQKKLCHLIIKRLADTVDQIAIADTIERNYTEYLKSLWSWTVKSFLTEFGGALTPEETERLDLIINLDFLEINNNIFAGIYGIPELLEYLLGQPGFTVDNINYSSDDPEVVTRIEFLLHNLIIHLANATVQIILNNFYNLEKLKYQLYRSEYKSDRSIARFRNQLSWKYRQAKYIDRPQNIFESRYRLYILDGGRIRSLYVYAPRQLELERLTGIPWLTTIIIEFRDAVAPLVRKFIALAGSGVVFVLTQVIGKGLGLIGKGIIQGIGSTIKNGARR